MRKRLNGTIYDLLREFAWQDASLIPWLVNHPRTCSEAGFRARRADAARLASAADRRASWLADQAAARCSARSRDAYRRDLYHRCSFRQFACRLAAVRCDCPAGAVDRADRCAAAAENRAADYRDHSTDCGHHDHSDRARRPALHSPQPLLRPVRLPHHARDHDANCRCPPSAPSARLAR